MNNDTTFLSAALAVTVAIIAVLGFVTAMQYKQLYNYKHPKFGFLGKPLVVILIAVVAIGMYSTGYYINQNNKDKGVDVSAGVKLNVQYEITNPQKNEYKFNAIPAVDGVQWSADPNAMFSIYWLISNDDFGAQTFVEHALTQNNPGGIDATLQPGNNAIKATIYYGAGEVKIEKEITIVIN